MIIGATGGELIQDFLLDVQRFHSFLAVQGRQRTTLLAAIAASKATYVLSLRIERRSTTLRA